MGADQREERGQEGAALRAGAFMDQVQNARVDKPFDSQQLREQVREWVVKARTLEPGQAA